jgi:hypothetical protein
MKKSALRMKKRKNQNEFIWHLHHDVLYEPLREPLENRIKYIREKKPAHEIEIRLRLMKPVKNPPARLISAWETHKAEESRAREVYEAERSRILAEYIAEHGPGWEALKDVAINYALNCYESVKLQTWSEYRVAEKACAKEMKSLHAKECNCAFFENGGSIFPRDL